MKIRLLASLAVSLGAFAAAPSTGRAGVLPECEVPVRVIRPIEVYREVRFPVVEASVSVASTPPCVIDTAAIAGNGRGIESVVYVQHGGAVTYRVRMGARHKEWIVVCVAPDGRLLAIERL